MSTPQDSDRDPSVCDQIDGIDEQLLDGTSPAAIQEQLVEAFLE
jgi:hypothetical protein